MTKDALLALGLLLSPASQLRMAGGAIGPGEICFALWLGLTAIQSLGRSDLPLTPAPMRILSFWLLFAAALSIGALTTYAMGIRNDPAFLKHDIQAYILVAGISFFCALDPAAPRRLNNVAWLLALLGSAFLTLQLAHAWTLLNVPHLDPWYWDRLRGWSENPNQLALLCIGIIFVSFHLAETAVRPGARAVALSCTVLPLVTGLLTRSDSFLLVLAVACPALAVFTIVKWLRSNSPKPGVRWTFAWFCILAVPAVLVLSAPSARIITKNPGSIEQQFAESNRDALQRDAPKRLELWVRALGVGMSSGMLGLGPGPHLDRIKETSVNLKDPGGDVRHPSEDPVPNFETHNTLLDLFTQGGVLAVLGFGWLFISTFLLAARANLASLAALLFGLAVFSTFHFVFRHPLLWFVIATCLVLASAAQRNPAQAGHRS
ncbi:MAG: O-antigen ligase family protein [Pseudomonadota bacterium]